MASRPTPHGNGFRTQWHLKGTREMQRVTVASEADCWKLKAWVEAHDHRVRDVDPRISDGLYLVEALPASGMTFGEYSADWIDRRVNANEESREGYRKVRRRCGELLGLPLHELTVLRVQKFLVDMERGKTVARRAYAANTRRETAGFIRSVMLDAENMHAVQMGPGMSLKGLTLPAKARKRAHRYLTEDEYACLRAGAFDKQTLDIFDLAVLTGVRIGEVFPMVKSQWERIPGDGGYLHLDRHIVRSKELIAQGTKSNRETGREFWVNEYAAVLLDRAVADAEDDLLFPTPERNVWRYSHWRARRWEPSVNRAIALGLDPTQKGRPTSHDLRHTHVDWCLKAGVELDEIQHRLGHASVSVTVDQYGPRKARWRDGHRRRNRRGYESLNVPAMPSS